MTRFLARRIAFGAIVLWVVVTVVFILYFVAPNDPARLIAGRLANAQTLAAAITSGSTSRSSSSTAVISRACCTGTSATRTWAVSRSRPSSARISP